MCDRDLFCQPSHVLHLILAISSRQTWIHVFDRLKSEGVNYVVNCVEPLSRRVLISASQSALGLCIRRMKLKDTGVAALSCRCWTRVGRDSAPTQEAQAKRDDGFLIDSASVCGATTFFKSVVLDRPTDVTQNGWLLKVRHHFTKILDWKQNNHVLLNKPACPVRESEYNSSTSSWSKQLAAIRVKHKSVNNNWKGEQ